MDRTDTDRLLANLETAIKRRRQHRGRRVFYQLLEYDLQPILAATDDLAYVRERARDILVKYGHDPEPPPCTTEWGQLSHLILSVPDRSRK